VHPLALLLGYALGLLTAAAFALAHLMRFVASDMEHFTRWLDRGAA
jgi:hypothetical protein